MNTKKNGSVRADHAGHNFDKKGAGGSTFVVSPPPACFSCRYTNNFQFQAHEHLGPKYERLICRTLPVKIGAKGKAMFPDRLSRKPVSVESDRI